MPNLLNMDGIPLVIGLDNNNNKVYYDLRKMPHLLVAGSTGSGKSVFLNNCIFSLLYTAKTELFLVDVKKVEFSIYSDIGGGINTVVNDVKKASELLQGLCYFMDCRYAEMQKYNCRGFAEYKKIKPNENYFCIIIDELADIILQDRKNIEKYIIRLAQLGRAAGIHLIIATQRPSHEIITGLIKDNIPSRLCFSLPSATGSRIVIDRPGAQNLHGAGDGLFLPIGKNNPIRIRAPYIATNDIIKSLETYKNL